MDRKPLSSQDVRDAVFDKAPLGKRGYNEKQVDEFLDRIEAALAGIGDLTAADVRSVVFHDAPLIKRGYHEEQVDEFLDAVINTFERLEHATAPHRTAHPAGPQPTPVPRPNPAEQTTPMPFILPPSLPADDPAPATEPLEDVEPLDELLTVPLPPAPPGARGYRPADVERLAALLAAAAEHTGTPTSTDLITLKLRKTAFNGQGYHAAPIDALITAWTEELRNREG